jgi:MSHA pilin protein MshD
MRQPCSGPTGCLLQRQAPARAGQRGATLIELVVALSVAAVLISGSFAAWGLMTRRSADPLVQRQSLAIAESLLGEIQLQAAAGPSGATGTDRSAFTTVADYNGLSLNGITDVQGIAVPGLGGYTASVTVSAQGLQGVPATHGWWTQVRVTGPSNQTVVLGGWKARRQ